MFIPKHFAQDDPEQLKEIIHTYPFATLITYSASGIESNHLPLLLQSINGKDVLQGHIAKANPLWKLTEEGDEVLVVFHGPNGYISPNYYPTKKAHGKAVPTWNYVVVHVRGKVSYHHDTHWKRQLVTHLTNQHEKDQVKPWAVSDAPKEFTEKMLAAIVGLQIEITSMVGKWKLSQNQPAINQQGVVDNLTESGSEEEKLSQLMRIKDLDRKSGKA